MLNEISLVADIVKNLSGDATASDISTAVDQLKAMSAPNSLSKKAMNGIYEFPFLVSGNIENSMETATMIKTMECEYANMLLISMGLNPTVNPNTNIKIQRTLSDYHTNGNDYRIEAAEYSLDVEHRSLDVAFEAWKGGRKGGGGNNRGNGGGNRNNNNQNRPKGNGRNYSGDFYDRDDYMEAKTMSNFGEANKPKDPKPQANDTPQNATQKGSATDADKNHNPADIDFDKYDSDAKTGGWSFQPAGFEKACNQDYAKMYTSTVLKVQLRLGETKATDFDLLIGVKGIPHYIPADEIDYVMESFLKPRTDSKMVRFLRWRSGEIKGLHNLLFRYDEIKRDAEFDRRVGTSNSWLKVLRSRGNNRKINLLTNMFLRNNHMKEILPNCTFVLTLQDVDEIESRTGMNIFTNPRAAKKLLDDSMGLGLVIVDPVHSTCHIMYSGYDRFSSYPIKSLVGKVKSDGDQLSILLDLMKKI